MPRVLLISFHYRPLGAVASERAKSWAENLARLGWNVDVLTHHWEQKNGIWMIPNIPPKTESPEDRLRIIRLGAAPPKALPVNSRKRKTAIMKQWISGEFDPLEWTAPAHEAMENWCNQHVAKGSYDIVLGIFSPHTHLKLCYEINRRTGIPYHLDFRDLWDNFLVKEGYKPAGIHRIKHTLILQYWKKWLNNSAGISTATSSLLDYIEKQFKRKGKTILTGFDASRLPSSIQKSQEFNVIYTGSLYNHQHYDLAIAGLKLFLQDHQEEPIKIAFHGIFREVPENGLASYSSQAADFIHAELKDDRVFTGGRISFEEIRQLQQNAQVLMMPTHAGVPGIIPGKLLEYLGAGTRILAIPPDENGIAEILENSGAGLCVNTPQEFAETLSDWYKEWQQDSKLEPLYPFEKRMMYSQAAQAKILSDQLKAEIK